MGDLVESPFAVDGPLADPWRADLELGYFDSYIPVAEDGIVTGEPDTDSHSIQRPDRGPATVVGIQLAADWALASNGEGSAAKIILQLAKDETEWYELILYANGQIEGWRAEDGGSNYVEVLESGASGLLPGATFGLHVDGATMNVLVSVETGWAGLFALDSGVIDDPIEGDLIPAFVIGSDVSVDGFFTGTDYLYVENGGPPEEGHLVQVVQAMAAALAPVREAIPQLQIYPFLNFNPTPPSIDIYPADLFQAPSGFGDDSEFFFTVRARVTTADHESGQRALLRMLDRRAPESVEEALVSDQSLGGTAQAVAVAEEGVSGYREYLEDPQSTGRLLGCEWRVRVIA